MSSSFTSLPGSSSSSKKVEKRAVKRIIGIDPGLASTGFGIIDYWQNRYKVISYGCIETGARQSHAKRLLAIYTNLVSLLDEFNPSEAGMETLYFAKNVSSAMGVAEARGVITLCFAQRNISLGEYTPNQIKSAVSGTSKADKKVVQLSVKMLLGLNKIPKPDHASDALAAAITHVHSQSLF